MAIHTTLNPYPKPNPNPNILNNPESQDHWHFQQAPWTFEIFPVTPRSPSQVYLQVTTDRSVVPLEHKLLNGYDIPLLQEIITSKSMSMNKKIIDLLWARKNKQL